MGKLARLLHGKNTATETAAPSTFQCTTLRGRFLDLPGEIRNQIYAYIIYPDLSSLTIANCAKPEHLAASALHFPLFRTCPQIRAECLSYLCTKIPLRILGLQTANVFFSCAGSAVLEIKSLALTQVVLNVRRDTVDTFFEALDIMHELVEIQIEVVEDIVSLERCAEGPEFLRRIEMLKERGVVVSTRSSCRLRSKDL